MAKRKRTQTQTNYDRSRGHDSSSYDAKASKLAVNSYEDVADSEDEFFAQRDKILLDERPDIKRRRRLEDDVMELSDEEVLGFNEEVYDDDDNDDEDDVDQYDDEAHSGMSDASEDPSNVTEDEETGISGWGSRKSDYYNTDKIETEQDALDEEAEARKIQQRQRRALREADFGFDENGWFGEQQEDEHRNGIGGKVTEILPQLQVAEDMNADERLALLKARYPEFEPLADEMMRLQPTHKILKAEVEQSKVSQHLELTSAIMPTKSIWKYRVLSGYLGAIAMYFALLTSTATKDLTVSLPMPATDLQEHDLISSLEHYQRLWTMVESLQDDLNASEDSQRSAEADEGLPALDDDSMTSSDGSEEEYEDREKDRAGSRTRLTARDRAKAELDAQRAARLQRTEERLKALDSLENLKPKPTKAPVLKTVLSETNHDSDLGDEQPLLEEEMADKARKRKSLRFYTSQIAQKANKRANAGRMAGGDDDIPHRERLKDRQERLNREAVKRGLKPNGRNDDSTSLSRNEEADDYREMTNMERDALNSDLETVGYEARMTARNEKKKLKDEAYRQAKEEGGRVIMRPKNEIGPDGRRDIGFAIEKNKGLTPKRKKEAKNPRVKKRKKFEEKSKKLRSMKPTYKGGEGRGGYGGELTGIKQNLVRSTKL